MACAEGYLSQKHYEQEQSHYFMPTAVENNVKKQEIEILR